MSNPDRRGLTSPPATPWDNAIRLRDILEGVRQVLRGAFSEAVWVFAEAHEIRRVEKGHVYLTLVDAQEDQVSTKAILWAPNLPAQVGGTISKTAIEIQWWLWQRWDTTTY